MQLHLEGGKPSPRSQAAKGGSLQPDAEPGTTLTVRATLLWRLLFLSVLGSKFHTFRVICPNCVFPINPDNFSVQFCRTMVVAKVPVFYFHTAVKASMWPLEGRLVWRELIRRLLGGIGIGPPASSRGNGSWCDCNSWHWRISGLEKGNASDYPGLKDK